MQLFREADQSSAESVGVGVRVLLLAPDDARPAIEGRLAALGARVETENELYSGLSMLIDDPFGYGLFVMACDAYGGLEAGERAVSMLNGVAERIPVVLVSRDCQQQVFPEDRRAPIRLRAPASAVSLRIAVELALRDRLVWLT